MPCNPPRSRAAANAITWPSIYSLYVHLFMGVNRPCVDVGEKRRGEERRLYSTLTRASSESFGDLFFLFFFYFVDVVVVVGGTDAMIVKCMLPTVDDGYFFLSRGDQCAAATRWMFLIFALPLRAVFMADDLIQ